MEPLEEHSEVACSLTDAEMRERRTLARRTLMHNLTDSTPIKGGLKLTFAGSKTLRADLTTFIDLEKQCCGFLKFTISASEAKRNSSIELRVEGPPDAARTIARFAQIVDELAS